MFAKVSSSEQFARFVILDHHKILLYSQPSIGSMNLFSLDDKIYMLVV